MSNLVKTPSDIAVELARYFVGSEEIPRGWKMNFLFPNGVKASLGYVDDAAFVETIDPDGSKKLWEGIQRSAVAGLLTEAMNRKTGGAR